MLKVFNFQGWRGSTKARHFVLALRDYYTEKYHDGSVRLGDAGAAIQCTLAESQKDAWALPYISMLHIQPLIEAFDDDASGFVTVSEANLFTAARPLDFRFVISHCHHY